MKARTSSSYVCTLDVNSVSDMQTLALIRKTVKLSNIRLAVPKRVVVRGRKPAVKMPTPASYFHRASNRPVSYDWAGNIVGGLANATKVDVYIYDRRTIQWCL